MSHDGLRLYYSRKNETKHQYGSQPICFKLMFLICITWAKKKTFPYSLVCALDESETKTKQIRNTHIQKQKTNKQQQQQQRNAEFFKICHTPTIATKVDILRNYLGKYEAEGNKQFYKMKMHQLKRKSGVIELHQLHNSMINAPEINISSERLIF